MAKVLMYSTAVCPYCLMAERLLKSKGVTEIEMMDRTGRRTVPQIYVGQRHVGGYDDLSALDRAGGLDALLATP
jgi:glutaredoxin 3